MLTIAYYFLKVIICSGILYGYYLLALRNKIFHRWNRFYLLAAVALSLAAPLIKINIFQKPEEPTTQVIHLIQSVNTNDEVVYQFTRHQQSFHIDASNLSAFIYMLISFLLSAILIKALVKINRLKHIYQSTTLEGINFFNTDAEGTPFSFFNNIFWNNKINLNTSAGKQIFKHEVAHVREMHSYDKIFLNVVLLCYWCNPIFWIIKKELNMIHEFIADKKAVEDGDASAFAAMILQATFPQQQFNITNNFFYSPLKRRLLMLTKNKHPKLSYLSRLLVLPFATLVFFAFTLKMKSQNLVGANKLSVDYKKVIKSNLNSEVSEPLLKKEIPRNNNRINNSQNIVKKNPDSIPLVHDQIDTSKIIVIVNGKILDKANLKNQYIQWADTARFYPPNDKAAIERYGEIAKYGALVISNGVISNKPNIKIDTNKLPAKVFTRTEIPAQFPGGEAAWTRYITKVIQENIGEILKDNKTGTCRVKFIVDKDGSVSDVTATSMNGTKLSEVAINAIKKGPKWIPAMQNGHIVAAYREQPVTFTISEQTSSLKTIKPGHKIVINILRGNNGVKVMNPNNDEGTIYFRRELSVPAE